MQLTNVLHGLAMFPGGVGRWVLVVLVGGPGAVNMLFPGPSWLWAGLDSGSRTFPVNPPLVIGGLTAKHDAGCCSVIANLMAATLPFQRPDTALLRVFIKRLFPSLLQPSLSCAFLLVSGGLLHVFPESRAGSTCRQRVVDIPRDYLQGLPFPHPPKLLFCWMAVP